MYYIQGNIFLLSIRYVITPRACARGKVIGRVVVIVAVVVVVVYKKSPDLGI